MEHNAFVILILNTRLALHQWLATSRPINKRVGFSSFYARAGIAAFTRAFCLRFSIDHARNPEISTRRCHKLGRNMISLLRLFPIYDSKTQRNVR